MSIRAEKVTITFTLVDDKTNSSTSSTCLAAIQHPAPPTSSSTNGTTPTTNNITTANSQDDLDANPQAYDLLQSLANFHLPMLQNSVMKNNILSKHTFEMAVGLVLGEHHGDVLRMLAGNSASSEKKVVMFVDLKAVEGFQGEDPDAPKGSVPEKTKKKEEFRAPYPVVAPYPPPPEKSGGGGCCGLFGGSKDARTTIQPLPPPHISVKAPKKSNLEERSFRVTPTTRFPIDIAIIGQGFQGGYTLKVVGGVAKEESMKEADASEDDESCGDESDEDDDIGDRRVPSIKTKGNVQEMRRNLLLSHPMVFEAFGGGHVDLLRGSYISSLNSVKYEFAIHDCGGLLWEVDEVAEVGKVEKTETEEEEEKGRIKALIDSAIDLVL